MKAPPFLRVLPTDVSRVGPLGACVLAAVRYATALPGEFNGRRQVDGETWWRASYDDIADAVGGAPRTVGSVVRRLLDSRDLTAIAVPDFYGDRAKAYRASELPSAESANSPDLPSADSADLISRISRPHQPNQLTPSAESADAPLSVELEEGGEKAEGAPNPEPQRYCDKHMPSGTDDDCGACGRRRRTHEDWSARRDHLRPLRSTALIAVAPLSSPRTRRQDERAAAGRVPRRYQQSVPVVRCPARPVLPRRRHAPRRPAVAADAMRPPLPAGATRLRHPRRQHRVDAIVLRAAASAWWGVVTARAALICYRAEPNGRHSVEWTFWESVEQARQAEAALTPCGPLCSDVHCAVRVEHPPAVQRRPLPTALVPGIDGGGDA